MEKKAKNDWRQYDEKWPGGLAKCFDTIILDEAHLVKNMETEVHGTIAWLKGRFHLCITATPLITGPHDFAGYLNLLEPSNANELWAPENLSSWKIGKGVNPYELPVSQSGRKLCLTLQAAQNWIFDHDIPGHVAGSRLRQIWKECLIRRTYASKIPSDDGPTIGESLPRISASVIEPQFTAVEHMDHGAGRLESASTCWRRRMPVWLSPKQYMYEGLLSVELHQLGDSHFSVADWCEDLHMTQTGFEGMRCSSIEESAFIYNSELYHNGIRLRYHKGSLHVLQL